MVYTRTLTLSQLPPSAHYLYLALYNLIYIVPLLLIMLLFVFTLGSRKLQAREGQILKLLSGLMMSGLGAVLVFAPGLLDRLWTAAALLLGAVAITWVVTRRLPAS
jgi:phosphoglycerol transferase MdoB-like AlkP superfamily enzyme